MTPHPQPEYIITEKRITDFENNLPEYIWINGARCKTSIVIAEIRYCQIGSQQSEWDKVLKAVQEKLLQRIIDWCNGVRSESFDKIEFSILIDVLNEFKAELRTIKQEEQP